MENQEGNYICVFLLWYQDYDTFDLAEIKEWEPFCLITSTLKLGREMGYKVRSSRETDCLLGAVTQNDLKSSFYLWWLRLLHIMAGPSQ